MKFAFFLQIERITSKMVLSVKSGNEQLGFYGYVSNMIAGA